MWNKIYIVHQPLCHSGQKWAHQAHHR